MDERVTQLGRAQNSAPRPFPDDSPVRTRAFGGRPFYSAVRQRTRRRREALHRLLADIAARAASEGVDIRVFGSVARGTAGPEADLDILVTAGIVSENRFRVMSWMQERGAESDIRVDVAFLDMASHLMSGSISCAEALRGVRVIESC